MCEIRYCRQPSIKGKELFLPQCAVIYSHTCLHFFVQGIGEPPLLLAASVHLALREAVNAARKDHGLSDNYKLECPATPEIIRMGCDGPIVKKVK